MGKTLLIKSIHLFHHNSDMVIMVFLLFEQQLQYESKLLETATELYDVTKV